MHKGEFLKRKVMADKELIPLSQAVEAIKTAILQGQYEANKDVNRIQLASYCPCRMAVLIASTACDNGMMF